MDIRRTARTLLRRRAPAGQPPPRPARPGARAAVAASGWLSERLEWEWTQHRITPTSWRSTLAAHRVDVVLVELDSAAVPGWPADDVEALTRWAEQAETPLVVWVTSHAGDRPPEWADRATQVFLADTAAVPAWRERLPATPVSALPPAAQPRLHSPAAGWSRDRPAAGVAFAHDEFAGLPADDRAQFDVVPPAAGEFDGRALARTGVVVEAGRVAARPAWPTLAAGSAQTPVLAEAGVAAQLPDDLRALVAVAPDAETLHRDALARLWQPELRDREAVRLARAIYAGHTFADRVERILHAVGVPTKRPAGDVSVIVPTNRPHQLDDILANLGRQEHPGGFELILVEHGHETPAPDVKARAAEAGVDNVTLLHADDSLALGRCMNLGVEAASGAYIAKMDDDNFYGRHYLTDLVAAFGYTDADIVGKWAHYVWLRGTGAVVLRADYAEHRYQRLVQGGSMLFRAETLRALRFADDLLNCDTEILNRAQAEGIKTYSADRFNFVSIRGPDRHAHAWPIADPELMNRGGRVVFYGDPRPHVEI